MDRDEINLRLLDDWQRDFPMTARPFEAIAAQLSVNEAEVLRRLTALRQTGLVTRVGAVVRPNTAGASTLAAMKVPPRQLEAIAAVVNAEPGVNHNYEREHDFNLWFVATASDKPALAALLGRVESATGIEVVALPLKRAHHIDLGFAIGQGQCLARGAKQPALRAPDAQDVRLLAAIEDGLPIISQPFLFIARQLGLSEQAVIDRLTGLVDDGVVSRFGIVVRHRALGFKANAMSVWDIADDEVDAVGELFAGKPFVTLCYQRRRAEPQWRYNLYCMVHGRERAPVLEQIGELNRLLDGRARAHEVLFSRRCFKQRGARFSGDGARRRAEVSYA